MKIKNAKRFPLQKLLLFSIVALLAGGIAGYLIRGLSSNLPTLANGQEAKGESPTMILLNKPNPTIEAELHSQTANEIIGNITIHNGSYDSAIVNIVEINGRLIGVPVDSEYFTQLQKGRTYQYHFLRLDPKKTYGIEASAIPNGKQPSALHIMNCSGQIMDGWLCSTTIPGTANFSD